MRKTIAAAAIAVSGLGVLGLGATAIAGAQDDSSDDEDGGWVQDALSGLVDDGTISQEQADAVEDALEDARPDHGFGHPGFGHRGFVLWFGGELSTVAESLGIGEDELRSALEDGRTIAEIAEEQGVEVQDVVDDIVAAQREFLDEAVADGDLTQEDADEILAGAEERATAFVNGEMPDPEDLPDLPEMPNFGDRGPGHEWRSPWGEGPRWHGESSEDDSSEIPATHWDQGTQLTM
jgi:polyhydroxyalkanoate synthesis regulator phasin